jgi:hypothetical protein
VARLVPSQYCGPARGGKIGLPEAVPCWSGWALRIVMPRNRKGTEHSKTLLSPVKIAYMRVGRLRAAT